MKENLIISACLLGIGCRYDGRRVEKIDISMLSERYKTVFLCHTQQDSLRFDED